MDIVSPSLNLSARDVRFGDQVVVQHLSVECSEVRIGLPLGKSPSSVRASVQIVISETELNRQLIGRQEQGLRDLALGLMTDKLRITGRYALMGPLAVPFALVAVPEITGGSSIRLNIRDVSIVGAALPGMSAQMIGERINARVTDTLNVEKLGLPVRLTGLRVEPGRLILSGEAALELPGTSGSPPAITDVP